MSGHCSRRRYFFALLVVVLLGGCGLRPSSWDEFASRTKTFKLFTLIPCDADPQEIPNHQTYFHAWYFGRSGDAYWIGWADAAGKRNYGKEIYVTAVWHIGINDYTHITPAYPDSNERNTQCAALLELPWSEKAKRPFFSEFKPDYLLQQAHVELFLAALIGAATCVLLLVACAYAAAGYGKDELGKAASCTLALLGLIAVNVAVLWLCSLTTENIERLRDYYQFYDSLPRGALDDLLPLSWSQVHKLIAGPPFPTETYINLYPFYVVLGASSFVWLVVHARAIAFGIYCVHSDPFRDLRRRARRRGWSPTPDEVMEVVCDTALTSSSWELEALGRRARALGLTDQRRK